MTRPLVALNFGTTHYPRPTKVAFDMRETLKIIRARQLRHFEAQLLISRLNLTFRGTGSKSKQNSTKHSNYKFTEHVVQEKC